MKQICTPAQAGVQMRTSAPLGSRLRGSTIGGSRT